MDGILESKQGPAESVINNVPKDEIEIKKDLPNEIKIIPDSSWLIAKLDDKDINHVAVESSFGAIRPYKPVFYIPVLVYMETLSTLRRSRMSFSKCHKLFQNFRDTNECRTEKKIDFDKLLEKHKEFSRIKISQLKGADFYIATEGLYLGGKILTCDREMRNKVGKYYKEIYFISDRGKVMRNEIPRLLSDIQKIIK